MVTEGYTEGHTRAGTVSLTVCQASFSESCPVKIQLALATDVESRLYGLQYSRSGRV